MRRKRKNSKRSFNQANQRMDKMTNFIPDWLSDSVTEDYLNEYVKLEQDPDEYYERSRLDE